MDYDVQQGVAVLERTPAALHALLGGLSDDWCLSNYGEGTFSPFDVVGHLIEGERMNWMVRVRLIVGQGGGEAGRPAAFPPFDRYAMFERSRGKSMGELLDEFARVRAENLAELRAIGLTPELLERHRAHPQLGAVTLRNVLAAWVVHDLGHTHQVAKAMAYQYRAAVGPFAEFLTILPRG